MRREIISRRARGRRDQHSVAHQLGHHDVAIHQHLDLRRLARFAKQRNLVDRGMGEGLAGDRRRFHFERCDADRLGRGDTLGESVEPPFVHQETDRAAVHSEHRQVRAVAFEHPVQGVEHEPVAAQGDERLRFVIVGKSVALAKQAFARARRFPVRREQADAEAGQVLGFMVAGRGVCAQASMSLAASIGRKT